MTKIVFRVGKQIWSLGDFLVTTPTNGHLGSISVLEPTQQKILT